MNCKLSPNIPVFQHTVLSDQYTRSSPIAHCTVISVPTKQPYWHSVLSAQLPLSSPRVHCTVSANLTDQSYSALLCQLNPHKAMIPTEITYTLLSVVSAQSPSEKSYAVFQAKFPWSSPLAHTELSYQYTWSSP